MPDVYSKADIWLKGLDFMVEKTILACLHDQNKSGFSKSPDWLEKSRPSKKATFVLIM